MLVTTRGIVGFFTLLLGTFANADEMVKACAGVAVRSIDISAELPVSFLPDAIPEITEPATSSARPAGPRRSVRILAYGPVLGSMDSPHVTTDLACTAQGIVLTATVTRSANFNGAAAQNVIWRPRISMLLVLRHQEIVLRATWRMRLTNGADLDRAQTPTYSEHKYPITVTKTIR